jgi:L-lactate utilization protein LutC
MRIPCNNKNIEFFNREKLSILFSQCAFFVDKTGMIVRIEEEEEEEMNCEKIMCLFFGPNWVYIRDKCP